MGGFSTEVQKAAEIVSVQADCLIEDALAMMHKRAESSGVSIYEIAQRVLDRRIRFG